MKPLVELRVLSGPALGAVVELPAGRYTVGADDACDIVLAADTIVTGHHLTLEIRQTPTGVDVVVHPLDGRRVVLNGVDLAKEGALLAQGEVLSLGFTALAWRPCGESWGPITLVPLEFAQALTQAASDKATVAAKVENLPQTVSVVTESSDAPESASFGAGESTASRNIRNGLILFTLLLVGALAVLIHVEKGVSRAASARMLTDELERAGIKTVMVLEAEDPGALLLRGTVADDKTLSVLARIAGAQPLRTYLDVRVGADLLRVARETLNAHDFYPEVSYEDGERLHLALYLKDTLTETRLLELGRDLPRLAQATRKVAYAHDVAPLLQKELRALGLDDGRVVYLPGKVSLPYRLTPDVEQPLAEALSRVRQSLGVPIVFQVDFVDGGGKLVPGMDVNSIAGGMPVLTATPTAVDDDAHAPGWKNALGGLTVMSVTLDAIPFVTMSNQQKFFPGAVLPNGVSLISIHTDHLVLQKDQETFTYLLKEMP